jgi:acyl dehydratase
MSVEAVRSKQPRDFDPVNFTVDRHEVSADNHPIHYDVEYARRHGHIAPVVHGLQVFAFTAPGATLFPQYIGDVFVAFTSASCKFLKEVHSGVERSGSSSQRPLG